MLAWAADSAGNVQTTFTVGTSSNVFFYDNAPSTSTIPVPVDKSADRTFTTFSGGAGDDFSGVDGVDLTISYLLSGNTYYWDGVAFSSQTYSVVASSVVPQNSERATWSYNAGALLAQLVNGQQYTVFSRSHDRSSNYEVAGATVTFLFDTSFATATFTDPVGSPVYRSPANPLNFVLGTAVDAPNHPYAGVARNELRVRRNPADQSVLGRRRLGAEQLDVADRLRHHDVVVARADGAMAGQHRLHIECAKHRLGGQFVALHDAKFHVRFEFAHRGSIVSECRLRTRGDDDFRNGGRRGHRAEVGPFERADRDSTQSGWRWQLVGRQCVRHPSNRLRRRGRRRRPGRMDFRFHHDRSGVMDILRQFAPGMGKRRHLSCESARAGQRA